MRKILIIFLCLLSFNCYANKSLFPKKYYIEPIDYLYLDENGKGHFADFESETKFFSYKYELINGMLFIYIENPGFICESTYVNKLLILDSFSNGDDKYSTGKLSLGFCNVINTEGFPSVIIWPEIRKFDTANAYYADCSSYLTEKNKSYPVENLNEIAMDTPWVENGPDDGIGEGFTIVAAPLHKYSNLLLMNGYISFDKPYLYSQNSRIKKLKITGCDSGVSKIVDVLDTPHPQSVDISFLPEIEDIRVEIEEVYKGTKYQDTCLHYCVPWDGVVTPLFDRPINSPIQ